MAISLDMFNLVVRIDALNKHYPGGFKQYKLDNAEFIEGEVPLIWHDDHIVREGAMTANDIEQVMVSFETYGLKSFRGTSDHPVWIDMCIVPTYGSIIGQCDWLEFVEPRIVQFKQS